MPKTDGPSSATSPENAIAMMRNLRLVVGSSIGALASRIPIDTSSNLSKIGFGRDGNRSVLIGVIFARVLGTHALNPCAFSAPIGNRRRPGRGEDAGIFDCELNLEPLARVARVDAHPFAVRPD